MIDHNKLVSGGLLYVTKSEKMYIKTLFPLHTI